jgi:hypothetical protein
MLAAQGDYRGESTGTATITTVRKKAVPLADRADRLLLNLLSAQACGLQLISRRSPEIDIQALYIALESIG